jgi:HlyD family secretion protein
MTKLNHIICYFQGEGAFVAVKRAKIIPVLILLLLFLALGYYFVEYNNKSIASGTFTSGTVEATEVEVAAEIGGKVKETPVKEGETVKLGQLLLALDDKMATIDYQKSQANLAGTEAQLAEIKRGARPEQLQQTRALVAQAQAACEGTQIALARVQETLTKTKTLFEAGVVAEEAYNEVQSRYDAAVTVSKTAAAQYEAAQAGLALLETGATREAIAAQTAGVAAARAGVEAAREQLARARILAPVEGTVVALNVAKGELVVPGQKVITLVNLERLWVKVFVAEPDLGKVGLGQQIRLESDAYPGEVFVGEIVWIASEAEFTPKNVQTRKERTNMVFAVKIAVANPDGKLKPGMPVDVRE